MNPFPKFDLIPPLVHSRNKRPRWAVKIGKRRIGTVEWHTKNAAYRFTPYGTEPMPSCVLKGIAFFCDRAGHDPGSVATISPPSISFVG